MKNRKEQDVTPVVGVDSNFFGEFMPDAESGLLVEDETPDAPEEEDDIPAPDPEETPEDDDDTPAPEDDETPAPDDEPEPDPEEDEDEDEDERSLTETMSSFVEAGILDIVDEDKEYATGDEGFQELVTDTVQARVEAARVKDAAARRPEVAELDTFLTENPEATVQDFLEEQEDFDYSTVDETEGQMQLYLLQDYYLMQGYTEEEVVATIKEHQGAKSVSRHAKKAKAALVKEQEKTATARAQAKEATKLQRETQRVEQVRQYEQKILKASTIGGIAVTPEDRQKLADYILKPVDNTGAVQLSLDQNEESELLYALLHMKKLDLSKLSKAAETKATVKFKKKLNKHTDTLAKPKKNHKKQGKDAADGDLSGLDSWAM